ncbi:MAG: flavin reductase family protein [Chitinophagaceae bacterium]
MHKICYPPILYFGTPVILVSTVNEDNTPNLAPISSVFWLGWRCIIGISAFSKTTENLLRTKEAVVNLPSVNEVAAIDAVALTTGKNIVPEGKKQKGYRYEPDKFSIAGLTPLDSAFVQPLRVKECPVQMECKVMAHHSLSEDNDIQKGKLLQIELKVLQVYVEEAILQEENNDKIDADLWHPLIMSFQQFYGLGKQVHPSMLSSIREELYTSADLLEAQNKVDLQHKS